jgi:predicted porin
LSQASTTAAGNFGINNFHARATGNFERQNNLLQFSSNTINGITFTLTHGRDALDESGATRASETKAEYTGAQVSYAAGPLSLGVGLNSSKTAAEQTDAAANSSTKNKLNWIGGSYNAGAFTLFVTHATREDEDISDANVATTALDAKLTGYGIAVPVGALTLRASAYSGKDKRGAGTDDNMKLSGHQVSAVYALSKRTSLVAATGKNEYKRDGAESTAATRKYQATTLTMVHTF